MKISYYACQKIKNWTAFGDVYRFTGPHLGRFEEIHLLQPFNDFTKEHWTDEHSDNQAYAIVVMLSKAYEAGRASMQQEMKQLLGLPR